MDEIAPHVPHSELLLAAKAEGLLRLGKHERAREFAAQVGRGAGRCPAPAAWPPLLLLTPSAPS